MPSRSDRHGAVKALQTPTSVHSALTSARKPVFSDEPRPLSIACRQGRTRLTIGSLTAGTGWS
ncbi:hypothetical protein DMR_20830 [Solidesulfovibrio magneticus RS-1]|uniref:Uncharacterized protein n=1 Tax=Solidesulfovibrio magneticus (strain ATCC 700980 / DSM 13731 / RS-1) TaxID=573370 RepID=C4XS51_SOLM1|nr:hypothetical protein DMR_20830 [Solidesulfovibrio magneticus RS-1]